MEAPPTHIDPYQAQELLGRLCMDDGCWLPYEKLFDPVYGSCLFCKETIREARKKKRKELLSILVIESDNSPDNDHGSSQSGNLVGGVRGICVVDHWNPHPVPPPPYINPNLLYKTWIDTPKQPSGKVDIHPTYDDPQQGAIFDCYFISAISSIAWYFGTNTAINTGGSIVSDPDYQTKPINFRHAPPGSPSVLYSVSGEGIVPAAGAIQILTDYSLPMAYDESFAGAKAQSGGSSWVSYYEKAFARYLETINKMDPSNDLNQPDVCRIPCGDPGETLRALMLKEAGHLIRLTIDPNQPVSNNATTVWNFLTTNVIQGKRAKSNTALKTIVPAVAKTHITAPSGIEYNDELIVGAHAYSLLGITWGNDKTTDKFVILRNPYGQNPGFTYGCQYKSDGSPKYNLLGNIGFPLDTTKRPQPDEFLIQFPDLETSTGAKYSIKPWVKETASNGDIIIPNKGTFAIHINDFVQYFSEIDYVMPT